jgi:hypothetical protein
VSGGDVRVSHESHEDASLLHNRQLLLFGAKREAVLDLWEVQRYGADSYSDVDHVSLYGMRPTEWYVRGIRLLGRTAVECTREVLAEAIATDVAALAASAPSASAVVVIDPFVGSGNTLYWILRRLPRSRGIGFELDVAVCQLTRRNLAVIESPIEVVDIDYAAGLAGMTAGAGPARRRVRGAAVGRRTRPSLRPRSAPHATACRGSL